MLWWHFNTWSEQNCSLQFALKGEWGRRGQEREEGFYIPSSLIYSKHAIPAWAEDNEKWLHRVGGSQVQPRNASPARLRWIGWTQPMLIARLWSNQSFSMFQCPLRGWWWFSGVFFHLYLFQGMPHTSKHVELPHECAMCVSRNV